MTGRWPVRFHADVDEDLRGLPLREKQAMANAVEKLELLGPMLLFPHTSAVRGVDRLRELRLRAGNSPWRALYRRVGAAFVVAAVAPEAVVDRRAFERACAAAIRRLAETEKGVL
jgi:hypothetical protein